MANRPVKTVLIGVGGYGGTYLDLIERGIVGAEEIEVAGAVDPYADRSRHFDYLTARGVPMYGDLESFYRERGAELAVISTPIPEHLGQCVAALRNGSAVLCEKPLVTDLADYEILKAAEAESGKRIGVGFQWSYSDAMLELKRLARSGELGKPVCLKALVRWPRGDAYYADSGWKGKRSHADGRTIRDSIASNAAAHYLFNILYTLGAEIDVSANPSRLRAELFRVKRIETFDTCFLEGRFDSGARLYFAASHAGVINEDPSFEYEFEGATARLNGIGGDGIVRVRFHDGRELALGDPFSDAEAPNKLRAMLRHASGGAPIPCGIEAVYPHVAVCDALDKIPVREFPDGSVSEGEGGRCVPMLDDFILHCYKKTILPSEVDMREVFPPDGDFGRGRVE